MRRLISKEVWQQIKTGYAAGIGLREIARNMHVPEGTVLARANREGWTQQIAAAKQASASSQSNAITPSPLQSIAAVMAELGGKTKIGFAKAAHKVARHCAAEDADVLMDKSQSARHWSAIAGTVHGWNNERSAGSSLNLNVLAGRGGRVLIGITSEDKTENGNMASPPEAMLGKTAD